MKGSTVGLMMAGALFLVVSSADAEDKFDEANKCYQRYGQVETVRKDGKKISTYKSEEDVAVSATPR